MYVCMYVQMCAYMYVTRAVFRMSCFHVYTCLCACDVFNVFPYIYIYMYITNTDIYIYMYIYIFIYREIVVLFCLFLLLCRLVLALVCFICLCIIIVCCFICVFTMNACMCVCIKYAWMHTCMYACMYVCDICMRGRGWHDVGDVAWCDAMHACVYVRVHI